MNEQMQPKPQRMTFSMVINSDGYKKLINNTIKDPAKAQRFVSAITSAVAINPLLQECDPATILSAALLGESLGLSPSPQLGQYYLVPFNNTKKGCKDAQFQLGYKGYIQLALRSGYYKCLNVFAIKPGELKKWNPLTEELDVELMEDDLAREKAESVGYVAFFEYLNGFRKTIYWSRQKMEAHALRYSKGYAAKKGYTFWEKEFDGMAFKTMLRQLISKWGIMSIELQTAFEQDVIVEEVPDALELTPPEFPVNAGMPGLEESTTAAPVGEPDTAAPTTGKGKKGKVTLDDL